MASYWLSIGASSNISASPALLPLFPLPPFPEELPDDLSVSYLLISSSGDKYSFAASAALSVASAASLVASAAASVASVVCWMALVYVFCPVSFAITCPIAFSAVASQPISFWMYGIAIDTIGEKAAAKAFLSVRRLPFKLSTCDLRPFILAL